MRTGISLIYSAVPDELIDVLHAIAFNWKADRWQIGDITNSIKVLCDDRLLPVSREDVYSFMAECLNQEVAARTIRAWADLAHSYVSELRMKYSDLPFSHFEFARSMGDDKKETVLDMSLARARETGKTPSVAWLWTALQGDIYQRNSEEMPEFGNDQSYSNDQSQVEDDEDSEPARVIEYRNMLQDAQCMAEYLRSNLACIPINDDTRLELTDLLDRLNRMITEVLLEVSEK